MAGRKKEVFSKRRTKREIKKNKNATSCPAASRKVAYRLYG